MKRGLALLALILGAALASMWAASAADEKFITVASTTSTENSGLFTYLLPAFTQATGIEVRVVAVGTGQALAIGHRGDADVVFVHDRSAELKFVAAGDGVGRREVMYNDFVVVGLASDPADIAGLSDAVAAFKKIAAAKAPFLSRGDKSGTNEEELRLWAEAGVDVKDRGNGWYRDTGSGMGATLNTAVAIGAYTLADRGTWLSFKNRPDLKIVVEGDKRLFNQYGVMLVNPERHPTVKREWGQEFIDWLTSPAGQQTIAGYKINSEQLFFPNYKPPGS
ncbi:MAG TPA: substrate-binding domain-containing protein [Stellaceae bacterium]|jgi:tungstate transport system substrate-binding protein|nr:substrate-binding domain-containing protein [Stellaceae bacterium]